MSIDMYLGSSDQQASSVGKVLQQRITAYRSLQRALEQLVSSSPDLSGYTYASAKKYSEQVLIPLMRGCILLDEAIKEACTAFPNDYRRQVDSVDLKESELVDQISRSDRIIGRYVELIDLEYRQELPNYSYIANLKSGASNQRQVKRKLEEKLLKLREFDSNSRHLFSSIAALAEAVNTGIRQTKTSWNGTSRTFTLPRALDLEWTKVVEKRWEKREIRGLDVNIESLLAQLEEDYKNGKINEKVYQVAKTNLQNGGVMYVQSVIAQLNHAYKTGMIDKEDWKKSKNAVKSNLWEFFDSAKSAVINGSVQYLKEFFVNKVTDKVAEQFINNLYHVLSTNPLSWQYRGAFATVSNTVITNSIDNSGSALARQVVNCSQVFGKSVPYIGATIDFGLQIHNGEDVGDAAIKSAAHMGIAVGVGTAVGGPFGFVLGVGLSMLFDATYDNKDSIVSDTNDFVDDVGDAVSGFFGKLGSAFG
ncbi:LXG domain-containing protein [Streptococcus equi]|uniref:LXG domain-containing protein n=2 Tax=Streptococcus equi TaxID=1336 RepID=UPI001D192499|nr:LXG domain-containing protein [Streptococcus equi]